MVGASAAVIRALHQVCQQSGQAAVRSERSRLHRSDRHVEPVGDLAVGEPLEVGEAHDLALVAGELVERGPYLERFPGALEGDRHDGVVDVRVRLGMGARFAAVDVHRRPAGDRRQPRAQRSLGVERLRRPPCPDEGLLHAFRREVAISDIDIATANIAPP